jgi:hypothetical protein
MLQAYQQLFEIAFQGLVLAQAASSLFPSFACPNFFCVLFAP